MELKNKQYSDYNATLEIVDDKVYGEAPGDNGAYLKANTTLVLLEMPSIPSLFLSNSLTQSQAAQTTINVVATSGAAISTASNA